MRGFFLSFGIHAAGVLGLVVLPSFSASELPPTSKRPEPPIWLPPVVRVLAVAPRILPPRRQSGGGGGGTTAPPRGLRLAQSAASVSEEPPSNEGIELSDVEGAGQGPLDQGPIPGLGPLPLAAANSEPRSLVRAHVDVRPPRKLAGADPVYPPLARAARVEGTVVLECTIGRDGRVGAIRVLRGHPLLNAAAVDGVTRWSYTPTLLNGVPVSVLMTVTVEFKLSR